VNKYDKEYVINMLNKMLEDIDTVIELVLEDSEEDIGEE
jgi:hypothetical protein